MFSIHFLLPGLGLIQIDDFQERFRADHSYWGPSRYELQWRTARKALAEGRRAMFITSITEPAQTNFFRAWTGYPVDGVVAFHEELFFMDDLHNGPFNEDDPHVHVDEYEFDADVSEWRTRP